MIMTSYDDDDDDGVCGDHEDMQQSIDTYLLELHELWTNIGVPIQHAEHELQNNLVDVYEQLLVQAKDEKCKLGRDLVEQKERARLILIDLGDDEAMSLTHTHDDDDDDDQQQQSLRKQLEKAREITHHLEQIRAKRHETIETLSNQIHDLIASLGEDDNDEDITHRNNIDLNNTNSDMSMQRSERLRELISYLTHKLHERQREVHDNVYAISSLMNELDLSQHNSLSHELDERITSCVATNSTHNMGANVHILQSLQQRLNELKNTKEEREISLRKLAIDITELWDLLDVPNEQRQTFLNEHAGLGLHTLEACQRELEALKLRKQASMMELTRVAFSKLNDVWNECCFTDEQKHRECPSAYSNTYTDETLSSLDTALITARNIADTMRVPLRLIEKRRVLLAERTELFNAQLNSNRFHIPGALIREEKLRANVKKKLPLVNQRLKTKIGEWETLHEKSFYIYGERFLDTMLHEECQEADSKNEGKQRRQVSASPSLPMSQQQDPNHPSISKRRQSLISSRTRTHPKHLVNMCTEEGGTNNKTYRRRSMHMNANASSSSSAAAAAAAVQQARRPVLTSLDISSRKDSRVKNRTNI